MKTDSNYLAQTILGLALIALVNCSTPPPPAYEPKVSDGCKANSNDDDDSADLLLGNAFKLKDPTWDDDIEEVFETYCFECHDGDTPPNLTKYSTVKKEEKAIIAQMIDSDDMPPEEALDDDELKLVEDWFDADMPESSSKDDDEDEDEDDDEDEDEDDEDESSSSSDC